MVRNKIEHKPHIPLIQCIAQGDQRLVSSKVGVNMPIIYRVIFMVAGRSENRRKIKRIYAQVFQVAHCEDASEGRTFEHHPAPHRAQPFGIGACHAGAVDGIVLVGDRRAPHGPQFVRGQPAPPDVTVVAPDVPAEPADQSCHGGILSRRP